jgi:hypothetical protein
MKTPAIVILAIAASVIVVAGRGQIIDEWMAVYPSDPSLKTSLQSCAMEDRQFNRLSTFSRQSCYDKWLPVLETRTGR